MNYDLPHPLSLISEIDKTLKRLGPKQEVKSCRSAMIKRFEFESQKQTTKDQGAYVDNSTYLHTIISQTTRGHPDRASITLSKGANSTTMSNQHFAGVRNSTEFDKENQAQRTTLAPVVKALLFGTNHSHGQTLRSSGKSVKSPIRELTN